MWRRTLPLGLSLIVGLFCASVLQAARREDPAAFDRRPSTHSGRAEHHELFAVAAELPRVRLITTGGTISNRPGDRLSPAELIASVPHLDELVEAETEEFANASSSSLTLEQWVHLSRRLNAVFAEDADLAGVVLTSGTDTLEELAYFLHLTVRHERPVVVVGSMRRPKTLGYDGAANLRQAFRVAADPGSLGRGVLVVLNDEINSAREVTKTDALHLQTFETRRYGALGVTARDRVVYYRRVGAASHSGQRIRCRPDPTAAAGGHRHGVSGRVRRPPSEPPWTMVPMASSSRAPARVPRAAGSVTRSPTPMKTACSS